MSIIESIQTDAEIARLRNELHIAQEWSARVIAGHEQDIAEITALRAENERLRAALRGIATYEIQEGCPCNACEHSALARAALEEK